MRKTIKGILSIVLAFAMIVTSITFTGSDVSAATLTQDEIDSIAGNGTMTNLAYKTTVAVAPRVGEGDAVNLTDGKITGGHCALGWGGSSEAYAIVDLGDYYKAESLDELILIYKDNAANDTVVNKEYEIQYSIDQNNWETVYSSNTVTAEDLATSNATTDNISGYDGSVRFIKILYKTVPDYGIQLTEIAVLAANPEKAPMDTCDDPAAVTASSSAWGEISFNITAGEDQEDYTYAAMLDGPSGTILNGNCQAGVDYTYEVPGGNHRIFVQSHKGTAISDGIYSDTVTVDTYETNVADATINYAYGKTYTMDCGASAEGTGSVTNGNISSNDFATATKGGTGGSWFTIDLGVPYTTSSFETICVWFRSDEPGCAPQQEGMKFQYSIDGQTYTDVAVLSQSNFTTQKGTQRAPYRIMGDVSGVSEGAVRFVRVYFPHAVAYGAQITEIGVYDEDGDAKEATVETVTDPLDFTAATSDYNQISGVITADVDQEDYTYNIYLNGNLKAEGLPAGPYILNGVAEGTYNVTVKSYKDGYTSHGLTVSDVVVEDSFTYTHTTGTGVYDDVSEYGLNLVTRNGATVSGVSATASAGNATSAIDAKAGTRWETPGSDPQWITVDLGAVKTVKAFEAWWETANSKDYTIDVSTDGENFKTVATIVGAAAGANRRDTIVLKQTASARYVRLHATARTTGYGHSIWELAIYDGQTAPDNFMDVTDYKATTPATAPTAPAGKIFAGWYEDAEYTTPYTATTGYAYAKFVDKNIFAGAYQVDNEDAPTAVRFLSTIDTKDYREIGFYLTGEYDGKAIENVKKSVKNIYRSITAAGNTILPTETPFSTESTYFYTYTLRNLQSELTMTYTPYFVTLDGTEVKADACQYPKAN